MPVLRAKYLDVPMQHRRDAAKAAKDRYQALLADPTLSKEQREHLVERVRRASKWEAGTLPTG